MGASCLRGVCLFDISFTLTETLQANIQPNSKTKVIQRCLLYSGLPLLRLLKHLEVYRIYTSSQVKGGGRGKVSPKFQFPAPTFTAEMVVHTCNSHGGEAEVAGDRQIPGAH